MLRSKNFGAALLKQAMSPYSAGTATLSFTHRMILHGFAEGLNGHIRACLQFEKYAENWQGLRATAQHSTEISSRGLRMGGLRSRNTPLGQRRRCDEITFGDQNNRLGSEKGATGMPDPGGTTRCTPDALGIFSPVSTEWSTPNPSRKRLTTPRVKENLSTKSCCRRGVSQRSLRGGAQPQRCELVRCREDQMPFVRGTPTLPTSPK